ncbi:MAG: nucleotidyltransferase domain-containing protein [Candidatus Omnitrophica bacterium]|nr:nucleotidyltransferase domain-containing protein [Candidatus Omnitrophota bacterium]
MLKIYTPILKDYFAEMKEIEIAYIFGSTVSGKNNALSDIDIAIDINRDIINEAEYPYSYKAHIIADLMGLLKTNNIDLVIIDEASILLKHRIIARGRLIYSRNEKRRIHLQVDALRRYLDVKPLFEAYR